MVAQNRKRAMPTRYSTFQLEHICGAIPKFRKSIKKPITSDLDLILRRRLQSTPLGSAYADASVSATSEMHSGNVSWLGCIVPSAFPHEFLHLFQIFALSK
jgi:hypothetical protein